MPYKWRNHNHFRSDEMEGFSSVVISGLRGKGAEIRDAYTHNKIPCVVVDYGYLNRVSGIKDFESRHWQVGLNRLGWIPPFECKADRFNALGIDIKPHKRGEIVYVCAQHIDDPSHGLSEAGIKSWAASMLNVLRLHTDKPIYWRPHPDSPIEVEGYDGISTGFMDWDDAHCVVCINSNIGLDALINGVPVFCDASAPYNALANLNIAGIDAPSMPSEADLRQYLHRVAYAQWTLDEMREGKTINFLKGIKNEI